MNRGFTMFELMITISIMVMIAALVLVNFPGFNRQVTAGRAAQEVSLALRSAQARALAVQKFVSTGQFPQGYGIYFDLARPNEYIIFADLCTTCQEGESGYGIFNTGEGVETLPLPKSFTIANLIAKEKTPPPDINLRQLHIVYYRPDPIIVMHGVDTNDILSNLQAGDVEIVLNASDGSPAQRKVVAWTTGQVSIEE